MFDDFKIIITKILAAIGYSFQLIKHCTSRLKINIFII